MTVIEIEKLTKYYGKFLALNEVDLEVKPGEVYGFIGPNGAGKTTTLRILLGLIRKDSGEIRLFDGDPWHDAVRLHRRMAYVPGDVNLWPSLTGGEVIDMLGKLRGDFDPERRDELLEHFRLDPKKKCGAYSTGNRQKVALISALVSDVELYILDEPTIGLDPLMEVVFRENVNELKKAGKTVLLSSHILSEVEALCDRLSIIRDGQIIETGTFEDLRYITRTSITVDAYKSITGLENLEGIHNLTVNDKHARFSVDGEKIDSVLKYLTQFGVKSLLSTPPTLEELFIRYYSEEYTGKKIVRE
ncbi:MAG: ABC transporter ATP-binding protein [Methanobacterium sp.]|jgi:ABC-2 type transport system ATP-binding protein|uniref:ABC transporter ATP-binding protein n=1 Tax=Methanobacterium subterraneum TaxID=59277 RepID=A0A2H4VQ00_9EURY|nr:MULTISPECIES: ABC transporter ATP-binding protein [Methanobacterium]AUB57034.1 ABC transporter ATP-binding protein [Methanobacterium sp. MZ-A1]AUB60178.1 ABC transporter ATP-binding protein [Methanobacterium subterraneum]MBW4257907.1 ABC transporter ATP-binding protein [Methanobacterium sp. YSL]MCC7560201.1 ABC transporter ATP-binding protein [Methanobacterium sp.]